jgi:hypothetical protein
MPIKLTWKSIAGACALLLGVIQPLVASNALPASTSATLVAVGGIILAVERAADAWDHRTDVNAPPAP